MYIHIMYTLNVVNISITYNSSLSDGFFVLGFFLNFICITIYIYIYMLYPHVYINTFSAYTSHFTINTWKV